jgi:hypothetical protein
MTDTVQSSNPSTARPTRGAPRLAGAALLLAGLGLPACQEPDQFLPQAQFGGPAGVVDGALTYSGALPCTQAGQIVGVGVLLAFDVRLLPPPDGLGTTAASIAIVPGATLFDGVRDQLTFDPGGARWCPGAKAPPVTVTANWAISPLPGGTYEIRGFYDHDGNFEPSFTISNLPTKGDVGGGAIDNVADVLEGKPPAYRHIGLGDLQPDGSRTIPDTGARVSGVAVTLGLTLPLERPIFHAKGVVDPTGANKDATKVVMPSDFQLATFDAGRVSDTEKSFLRLTLGAGVAPAEVQTATQSPFDLPVPALVYSRQDVDGNGVLDGKDHVPDSALIPSLYPLTIFSRLADGADVNQAKPAVILQGLTIYKSLLQTALSPATLNDPQPEVVAALRPSVLCIDPLDVAKHAVLLVTHPTDAHGNKVVPDAKALTTALAAQFGRPVDVAYGCLPQGRYAMNLVYGTGQAWSVPNEAGVCAPSEAPSADGKTCGTRPRLASQGVVLTIGAPKDAAYCAKNPTPAACLP